MPDLSTVAFDERDVGPTLDRLSPDALDELAFGVIGFDATTVVRRYNAPESRWAGLRPESVLGKPLFEVVAPCMNNFLVAHRFDEAAANGDALDATIDYVLTFRMRPQKVRLRLVATPGSAMRYVLILRRG